MLPKRSAAQESKKHNMTVREIITPPKPTLRKKAKKVRNVTPALQSLVSDMIETMRASSGVGLAAPQIDVSQRVIVVEYGEGLEDPDKEAAPPKLYVLINPEIVRHATETVSGDEACLSVPGYYGEVKRYEAVTVKGLDRDGKPLRIKAKGWLARIFQHEIDHLDGVLFIDRADPIYRVEAEENAAETSHSI
jgi:peptide deformylase